MSRLANPLRLLPTLPLRTMHTSARRLVSLDRAAISDISQREKMLTGHDAPVKGGPTAQAQRHANEPLGGNPQAVSDIARGEMGVTGLNGPIPGGPAAAAQSAADSSAARFDDTISDTSPSSTANTARLDSSTISGITAAEKGISGTVGPIKGGPTAQAQKHANEQINSQNLHDISMGERAITGQSPVAGGPTATAQSKLAKSRS